MPLGVFVMNLFFFFSPRERTSSEPAVIFALFWSYFINAANLHYFANRIDAKGVNFTAFPAYQLRIFRGIELRFTFRANNTVLFGFLNR